LLIQENQERDLKSTPVTRDKSNESTGAIHEVLRNVDAARLFESAPDAVVLMDGQGRIAVVNAQVEKIFGYRREELVGEPVEKLIPERFRTGHIEHRVGFTAVPRSWSMVAGLELYGRHRAGHEFPVEISSSPLETEEGVLILSAIRDVSDLARGKERKRNEEAIAAQLKFETLLAELSTIFISTPASQVDGQIQQAQKLICEVFGLDRSTLALVPSEVADINITHSWAAEGIEPTPRVTRKDLPWIVPRLLSGQRVSFARTDDLPDAAAVDKETYRRYGQKSSAIFPLSAEGKVIGALSFGSLRAEPEWSPALLERLSLVAHVFANALVRAQADERLHQAYDQIEQLKQRLEKANLYLREETKLEHQHHNIIGQSEAIRSVLKNAEQVANTGSTVLILGETGTGKELIARAIHESSSREARTMVKVNCAALPASLVESELFGREKGAYTGALTREVGRFELANDSTIFLDEIGELPLELQAKLLRVLQEGEFERLGSSKTIQVNVRVIAATSRHLPTAVKEGKFREDLFYRLNVFPIQLPPLRERKEDIPALTWHFVRELGRRMARNIESIRSTTMEGFQRYPWPGNVRELRNVIERALIVNPGPIFQAELPGREEAGPIAGSTMEEMERQHILQTMNRSGWRIRGKSGAAEILGLKPSTLESRMKKLKISRLR
jgi:PAS domain S-box-containing protein